MSDSQCPQCDSQWNDSQCPQCNHVDLIDLWFQGPIGGDDAAETAYGPQSPRKAVPDVQRYAPYSADLNDGDKGESKCDAHIGDDRDGESTSNAHDGGNVAISIGELACKIADILWRDPIDDDRRDDDADDIDTGDDQADDTEGSQRLRRAKRNVATLALAKL